MSSETVMSENGAAQCSPSDCGERSLIRECDSHRPWETDLFRARDFESRANAGTLCAEWDTDEIDSRSISLRPARLPAS